MKTRILRYKYPWRDGHRLDWLVDGASFFPAMVDAIDKAQQSVVLVIYQVHPGQCAERFLGALSRAAGRGVAVYVLVDGFGGFPAREELRQLRESGAAVQWFNPVSVWRPALNLFRDHRKLLVVDEQVGFIGGFCITDGFDERCSEPPWHDVMVRVEGPCVMDMLAEFRRDWRLYGGVATSVGDGGGPGGDVAGAADTAGAAVSGESSGSAGAGDSGDSGGNASCRLVRNHPRGVREIRRATHERMRDARQRLWLVTPYFAPPRRTRRALAAAARRGVDVRLLLSGPLTDHPPVRSAGWRHYPRLLRAGVRILEIEDRYLHLKAVVADEWASVGSCNFDHWGLRWNRDANLETTDPAAVGACVELLEKDFEGSCEITLKELAARSWLTRMQQWVASLVDGWVARASYRRQVRLLKRHPGRPRRD